MVYDDGNGRARTDALWAATTSEEPGSSLGRLTTRMQRDRERSHVHSSCPRGGSGAVRTRSGARTGYRIVIVDAVTRDRGLSDPTGHQPVARFQPQRCQGGARVPWEGRPRREAGGG